MKNIIAVSLGALALCNGAMALTVYNDPAGDVFTGAGGGILDILQMEVTNSATDITFKFTVAGDVTATDWAKFMVAIDSAPGGDPGSNGWARPISMPAGMDTWLGGWTDSGNGLENRRFIGGSWQLVGATYNATPGLSISKTAGAPSMVIMTVNLADAGLVPNQLIFFDAFTSGGGGGDSAVDSLANPNQSISDWGNPYSFGPGTQNPFHTYLISVPGPSVLGLLGVAGLAASRRRR